MAGLTYREAGVDTRGAAALVGDISQLVASTQKNRKLFGAFGLFAAAFDLKDYNHPVIVTGCDGVGTKLELLLEYDLIEWAGKDLVAMSVNDILTTGGDPLLFLDYIGVPHLDKERITRLIAGMCAYLESCNCILAGGETAEMPGVVPEGVVELAGFCIGCSERENLIDPTKIAVGDRLVGFASDGPHANGWSLIRRVLAENPKAFSQEEIKSLLAPTRLYHDVVYALRDLAILPKGMAHITGGGLPENVERLLSQCGGEIRIPQWENEAAQKLLTYVDSQDCYHALNMGIGWVVILSEDDANRVLSTVPGALDIGRVTQGEGVSVTATSL